MFLNKTEVFVEIVTLFWLFLTLGDEEMCELVSASAIDRLLTNKHHLFFLVFKLEGSPKSIGEVWESYFFEIWSSASMAEQNQFVMWNRLVKCPLFELKKGLSDKLT